MFSSNQTVNDTRKDTVINVKQTGKFVWNLATWDHARGRQHLRRAVPYGVDEFEQGKVANEPATLKDVPMAHESQGCCSADQG